MREPLLASGEWIQDYRCYIAGESFSHFDSLLSPSHNMLFTVQPTSSASHCLGILMTNPQVLRSTLPSATAHELDKLVEGERRLCTVTFCYILLHFVPDPAHNWTRSPSYISY